MGNAQIESNERRDRKDPATVRSLHREVKSYKDDNERIMKAQKEILQSLIVGKVLVIGKLFRGGMLQENKIKNKFELVQFSL